jgi:hypothetical protein
VRALFLPGLVSAVVLTAIGCASASSSQGRFADVGHRLSIFVPSGWRVSHRSFTRCSDPVERFSLLGPGQILTVEERLVPVGAERSARPQHFSVRGRPTPVECCSIQGRRGWVVQFGDHGRAFYVYLYPGRWAARTLLRLLDSFRVG